MNIPNKLNALPYNGVESRIKQFGQLVNDIVLTVNDISNTNKASISFHIEKVFLNLNKTDFEAILWHSKLFTLNMIASTENKNEKNELMAVHIFLINLLSNSRAFGKNLNNYNHNKLQTKEWFEQAAELQWTMLF